MGLSQGPRPGEGDREPEGTDRGDLHGRMERIDGRGDQEEHRPRVGYDVHVSGHPGGSLPAPTPCVLVGRVMQDCLQIAKDSLGRYPCWVTWGGVTTFESI